MKLILTISLFILKFAFVFAQSTAQSVGSTSSDSILARTYAQLNKFKSIKYDLTRDMNYISDDYRNISNWSVCFDFQEPDTVLGFKYQIDDLTLKQIFNGTEEFQLNKKDKTIQVNDNPAMESFRSIAAFYNSIITIKNILPLIIGDKTVIKTSIDTIIDNKLCNAVTINIGNRTMQSLGEGMTVLTSERKNRYIILIDKNSGLPLEIIQKNGENDDYVSTKFSKIETDLNAPSETSWYYTTYTNEYRPPAEVAEVKLLPKGTMSPEWKLEDYNDGKMVSLSDLKGQVVLLDFWIKNCGPCKESIPRINELHHKYKGKKVKIISINAYESKEVVSAYCIKNKVEYPVLLNGKSVAEKYGVNGFPAFFVIDKRGKIVCALGGYTEGNLLEIEKAILKAL